MQKHFRSVALVPHPEANEKRWLSLWHYEQGCYDFIDAEREGAETFRECIRRQACHSLGLRQRDVLVANMAQINLEFAAVPPAETEYRHFGVAFYLVKLFGIAATQQVETLSHKCWLTPRELLNGETEDGQIISPLLTFLLRRAEVIQDW